MREQIDPKELKTLSDILALVLEDQPGQAASALEAVRARARRNGVTGGALKNLFVAIAPNPPAPKAPRARAPRASTASTSTATPASATELQASRARISHLSAEVSRLDLDLRGAQARVEALRSELHLTRQARAEAQQALLATQHSAPRRVMLLVTALCGLLIGIAGTSAVMTFMHTESSDNSRYLQ
jgi:hypothetical protein